MKKQNTRRAFLMSLLSLLLCASMLVGTTFAWFTDTVVSSGNVIKSGKLEIAFGWANGAEDVPTTAAGWTNAESGPMFTESTKWEPGYTDAKHIRIANVGNLALKYYVQIEADGAVSALADVIDVYVIDPAAKVESRQALAGKTPVGTLAEVIKGVEIESAATLKEGESDEMTLVMKMQETAGNEYQEKSIGTSFSVKIYATQLTEEKDSFDQNYDAGAVYADAYVSTADELYAAVAAASDSTIIGIRAPIALTKTLSKAGLKSITFTAASADATLDQATYHMSFNGAKVTFKDLTLTHGEKAYGDGGQASTTFTVFHAKEVNYIDCTFNRSVGTLHAALHNFIGCTFNGVENPGNTKSEYPLCICDGQEYNVIDCTFNCTNRGAILFYNDGGSGTDTLNISGVKFFGDIIADKTAVEIHNNSTTQVYNVNIKDVLVGPGVINGLYRIKPANVGPVNVNVDDETVFTNVTTVSTKAELLALSDKSMTSNNGVVEEVTLLIANDIDLEGATFSSIVVQYNDKMTILGNGKTISGANVVSGVNDNTTGQAGMFYGYSGSTLTISDLTLKDITVTADLDDSGYAGAIVGYGECALNLNNVDVVNATVNGEKSSGLMVGHAAPTCPVVAIDCDLTGTVTLMPSANTPSGHYAGQYFGTLASAASLTNCTASATLSGNLAAANLGDVYGRTAGTGALV